MNQFYGSAKTIDSVLILGSTLAQGVGGGAFAFTLVEVQAAYAYPQPTDALLQSPISNPQSAIQNLLTTRQNKAGTAVISHYNYSVDVIGPQDNCSDKLLKKSFRMNQFCITSRTGDPHGDLASSNLLATATNTWEPNSNNT